MSVVISMKSIIPNLPDGVSVLSTDWEASTNSTFTDIVFQEQQSTDLFNKTILLSGEGPYYVRSRFTLSVGTLDWSLLSVCGSSVDAPNVTLDGEPDNVAPSATIRSTDFQSTISSETHLSTDYLIYEIATDFPGGPEKYILVYKNTGNQLDLTEIQVPAGILVENKSYIARVRHNGTLNPGEYGEKRFTVSSISIRSPTVEVVGFPNSVPEKPLFKFSPFLLDDGQDVQVATEVKIYKASGGAPVVEAYTTTPSDFFEYQTTTALARGQSYNVVVRFIGASAASPIGTHNFNVATTIIATPDLDVQGEPSNVPGGPLLKLSPFTTVLGTDQYKTTSWQITDPAGNVVWQEIGTSTYVDSIQVPAASLTRGQNYVVKAKYSGQAAESAWASKTIYVDFPDIVQPVITSIAGEPDDIGSTPVIETSAFTVIPAGADVHVDTVWTFKDSVGAVVAEYKASDYTDGTIGKTKMIMPAGILNHNESYTLEVVFKGNQSESNKGTRNFSVALIKIALPTITVPGLPSLVDSAGPTFTTSPFTVFPGTDMHTSTDWYFYDSSDNLLHQSVSDKVNFTSYTLQPTILAPISIYKVKVRYNGLTTSSDYASITFQTKPL